MGTKEMESKLLKASNVLHYLEPCETCLPIVITLSIQLLDIRV